MNRDSNDGNDRRNFLAGAGVIAAGASIAAASGTARAASASGFTPERHAEDGWMDAMGGKHRVFLDSSDGSGGIQAMNYANNMLRAHAMGYGGTDSDYAIVVCFRHDSSPFGFNDAMWEKYGRLFMGRTGVRVGETDEQVKVNPVTVANSPYGNRSNTVDALRNRGVRFAICNLSTLGMADQLSRSTGVPSDEVYQELVDNAIPDSHIVPAGIMAASRAQEYGFTFLYSA